MLIEVEKRAKESMEKMKERLQEKISQVLTPNESTWREIVLLADRLDITEEVVRLRSHLEHFEELLKKGDGVVGRKMDFLVQEMGREINTTGAKSADELISRFIIEMKSELEKIKEQVQNIE